MIRRLSINMMSQLYRTPHCKIRLSCLDDGNLMPGKAVFILKQGPECLLQAYNCRVCRFHCTLTGA